MPIVLLVDWDTTERSFSHLVGTSRLSLRLEEGVNDGRGCHRWRRWRRVSEMEEMEEELEVEMEEGVRDGGGVRSGDGRGCQRWRRVSEIEEMEEGVRDGGD